MSLRGVEVSKLPRRDAARGAEGQRVVDTVAGYDADHPDAEVEGEFHLVETDRPVRAISAKIGGGVQVERSTTAVTPGGSTRARLPASPPPVTCANACAPASAARARQSWA